MRSEAQGRKRLGRLHSPDAPELTEPVVVTSLGVVPARSGRVRVALNGHDVGGVTIDFVSDASLRTGTVLQRTDVDALIAAVRRTTVLDKALDLLAVRARSSRDLGIRLRRAGANDGDIDWALDRLTRQGFVDDASYARQVARAKVLAGGVSRRRVVTALRKRGVSAEVADEAIDATLQDVSLDEEGAALAAAQKRLRALRSLDERTRRQRLYAFLARRGYDGDVVRRVLKQVLGA